MTYLELVNTVLRRVREKEVPSVNATTYSKLIGDLLNDVKDEVEYSWNWNALRQTYIVNTGVNVFNYVLTGAVSGTQILNAWNETGKTQLLPMSTLYAEKVYLQDRQEGSPAYYNVNGVDENNNLLVDVYPIPNTNYTLTFNVCTSQPNLVNDSDRLWVPPRPVIEGTVARAITERGEDGGTASSVAEARYNQALSDAIAADASLHPDEVIWVAV
jgi:hypothetical protein